MRKKFMGGVLAVVLSALLAMTVFASPVDNLKEINERTKIPFELTVSIGIASSDGFLNLKELIDLADEEMYKAKEASRKGDA